MYDAANIYYVYVTMYRGNSDVSTPYLAGIDFTGVDVEG
jgi:hypothetical protein